MDFAQILTNYVLPILVIVIGALAAGNKYKNLAKTKSMKEVVDTLLQDESVCDLFDDILFSQTGQQFDTLDEYTMWAKQAIYGKIITYLKEDLKFPDAVVNMLTMEDLSNSVEAILEKFDIYEAIKEAYTASKTTVEDISISQEALTDIGLVDEDSTKEESTSQTDIGLL